MPKNYWPVVVSNMRKERRKWTRFYRILGWEGVDTWTSSTFYKAVVQATLFFGTETWVTTPRIGRTLGRFHYRVDRCLVGIQPQRDTAGRWVYPPLEAAMAT